MKLKSLKSHCDVALVTNVVSMQCRCCTKYYRKNFHQFYNFLQIHLLIVIFSERRADICFYTPKSVTKTKSTNAVLAKQAGETWQDGPCTTCTCKKSLDHGLSLPVDSIQFRLENEYESECVTTKCSSIEAHPDANEFVIEGTLLDNQCCPTFKRTACKDKNNTHAVSATFFFSVLQEKCFYRKLDCIIFMMYGEHN